MPDLRTGSVSATLLVYNMMLDKVRKYLTAVANIVVKFTSLICFSLLQLAMSPGELSNSDSNHGWSSSHPSLGSHGGHGGHRGGGGSGGELPISDNNVTTTNGALDAAEWDIETESDIDVSIFLTL